LEVCVFVIYASGQTDKQHTDMLSAILGTPTRGRVSGVHPSVCLFVTDGVRQSGHFSETRFLVVYSCTFSWQDLNWMSGVRLQRRLVLELRLRSYVTRT